MVGADRRGDIGQVAVPAGRDDGLPLGRGAPGHGRQLAGDELQPVTSRAQLVPEELVEGGDAVVVEPAGDGPVHRELLEGDAGMVAGPGQLAADVPEGVGAAAALELVDGDGAGEVEHVDLLELGRGAELGRHHVQREVDVGHHGGVALPDAGRLHDHQVEAGGPAGGDGVVEAGRQLAPRAAGGEGAEVHPPPGQAGWRRDRPPPSAPVPAAPAPSVSMAFIRMRSPSRAPPPGAGSGRWPGRRCAACPPGRAGSGGPARRSARTCPNRRCR